MVSGMKVHILPLIYITAQKVVQNSNSLFSCTTRTGKKKFLRIIQFRNLYLPFCYIHTKE